MATYKIVHYINQFFAGIGGEEQERGICNISGRKQEMQTLRLSPIEKIKTQKSRQRSTSRKSRGMRTLMKKL